MDSSIGSVRGVHTLKRNVLDLFAGAGGLSLGFSQTGEFRIVAAVENNLFARRTYHRNMRETELLDDVETIDYDAIIRQHGKIHVVIGGPPCQGFSSANRQKNQAISTNNRLVKAFVRAVCVLKPQAFVMENVSMLRSDTHRFYYSEDDRQVLRGLSPDLKPERLELLPTSVSLKAADKIVQNDNLVTEYRWDDKAYWTLNVLFKQRDNEKRLGKALGKYGNALRRICQTTLPHEDSVDQIAHWDFVLAQAIMNVLFGTVTTTGQLRDALEKPILVQRMLGKLRELKENNIVVDKYDSGEGLFAHVQSYGVFDYVKTVLGSDLYKYNIRADVLNAADFGVPQRRMRFVIMGTDHDGVADYSLPKATVKPECYATVRSAIGDLEFIKPSLSVMDPPIEMNDAPVNLNSLAGRLRDSTCLHNHVITQTGDTALRRFRALAPGENFHNLRPELKSTYTDPSRTQNTIYLRLKYDEPSGTVVNIRKSMWIHPVLDRAVSIREAARLQSFPDRFVFEGTKDAQYQQVGNAVPPLLACALAEKVMELLDAEGG